MSDMSEIIKSSLDGIKTFADAESVIGNSINTPSGVTIIPISKLTVGFLGGGVDYGQKKLTHVQNFGGGSGAGVSITPIAFLTVTPSGDINLINVNDPKECSGKLFSLIERSPEIIDKIKGIMS